MHLFTKHAHMLGTIYIEIKKQKVRVDKYSINTCSDMLAYIR